MRPNCPSPFSVASLHAQASVQGRAGEAPRCILSLARPGTATETADDAASAPALAPPSPARLAPRTLTITGVPLPIAATHPYPQRLIPLALSLTKPQH